MLTIGHRPMNSEYEITQLVKSSLLPWQLSNLVPKYQEKVTIKPFKRFLFLKNESKGENYNLLDIFLYVPLKIKEKLESL